MTDRRSFESHRSGPGYSLGATYQDACDEALRRGDHKVGTEHLLVVLLLDPKCAQAVGHDLAQARAALDAIDMAALAAVGVDASACRPPALDARHRDRFPLTPAAKQALHQAAKLAQSKRFGPEHLLGALGAGTAADPAMALLAQLEVDPNRMIARLQHA